MEEELKVSTLFVHFSLVNAALLLFLVSILMIQFVNSLYHVSLPKSRFYYSRRGSKTWNIVIVFTFTYLSYVYICVDTCAMHECWRQRISFGSPFFSSSMCILGVELKRKLRLEGKHFYPLSHLTRPRSFSYYNFYEIFSCKFYAYI